jgi:two-component system, cell cycle sensor histidine kinase and response regulator CckA
MRRLCYANPGRKANLGMMVEVSGPSDEGKTLLAQSTSLGARQSARAWFAQVCAGIAFGIALLAGAGWLSGGLFLAGQWGGYIPMAPSTALALLLLSSGVFSHARWPAHRLSRRFALAAACLPALMALLVLAHFFAGFDSGIEWALSRTNELAGQVARGRMSPLTAAALLLESAALLLLIRSTRWRSAASGAVLFALLGTAMNLVVWVGYLYGAPLLYGGGSIPVALPTALAFLLVGAGQIRLAAPGVPALAAWSGDTMRGVLIRAFLPALLVFVLIEDWLATRVSASLNPAVLHSLTALLCCAVIAIVASWAARRTGDPIQRAIRALEESRRLRADTERIGKVGGWEFDIDTQQHTWTEEIYRVHEVDFTYEPTVSKVIAFCAPDSRPILERAMQRAAENGEPFDVELQIVTAKGNLRWVNAIGQADLKRRKVFGFFQDITVRKQAEDALRETEEQYRDLFEWSSDALFLVAADTGQIIAANKLASELYGYDSAELLTKTAMEMSAEPDETWQRVRETGAEPGQLFRIPLRMHRKKDGTVFPVEISARSHIRHGRALLLVSCRDVTERERAEAKLRKSEERFRQVVESAGEWVWEVDASGLYTYASPVVEKILGHKPEDLVGKRHFYDLFHPEDQGALKTVAMGALAAKQPLQGLVNRNLHRDGRTIWISTNGFPILDAGGNLQGYRGADRDITERKRVERHQDLLTEVLELFAESSDLAAVIPRILAAVKRETSADEVGMRLRAGGDLPHYSQDDFPSDFTITESTLVIRTGDGAICRGKDGSVCLAGTCCLVRSGEANPDDPLLTAAGSWWANDTAPLLELIAEEDPRLNPRNRCIRADFHSMALIPIRAKTGIVGVLQLTYRLKDALTLAEVNFFEGICGVLGVALERKRAEEALAESERRLRAVFEQAAVGVAVIDTRTFRFKYANPKYCEIAGLTAEAITQTNFLAITHPDDREENLIYNQRLRDGEIQDFSMEKRYVRPDGSVVWVNLWASRLWDAGDTPLEHIAIIEDITERKRAEEALRKSETRLRAVLDVTPFPSALVDVKGQNIGFWSHSALTLFGHTAPAASEWYQLAYPDPDYRREAIARWNTAEEQARLSGQVVNAGEYRVTCHDGSARVCELYAAFLEEMLVVTFNDITERKRAEEENTQLQFQLAQTQKMESIGRLAGGVAHDFNNLLTVIMGYSSVALRDLMRGEPTSKPLLEIRKAAEKASELTRQLLTLGRTQVLQPKNLDLNSVIADSGTILRRMIGEDIQLVIAAGSELGLVRADSGQINQILMNLAVNSRDAMPEGGTLVIETANVELDEAFVRLNPGTSAGSYVMLSVRDNGAGMDRETQARAFEPFFTTKEVGKGRGLGLSTVYGIVKYSGGYITAHSETGHGTEFKIYLPRVEKAAEEAEPPEDVAVLGGGENVLVVEDQAEVREFVADALRMCGYRAIEASNGDDALSICEREDVSLLLTDVVMPGLNGWELAERLVRLRPGVKVLFMSGHIGDIIVCQEILEKGANFIAKPFSPEQLAIKVRAVLAEADGESLTVLVAEDFAPIRERLSEILRTAGYAVVEACDGAQALTCLRDHPVQAALLDANMPGRSGVDVAREIRKQRPEVKIILMSAAFDESRLVADAADGIDAILAKPFPTETLLAMLRRLLVPPSVS